MNVQQIAALDFHSSVLRKTSKLKRWSASIMDKNLKTKYNSSVDEGLVAMFLKMSPEERLKSNDNAVRAILELRNAYKYQKDVGSES
jgi:hypothetical protein